MNKSNHTLALRLGTGVLSLMSLCWLIFRLYNNYYPEIPIAPETPLNILNLVLPTSSTLVFGYIAIKGKIPFMSM